MPRRSFRSLGRAEALHSGLGMPRRGLRRLGTAVRSPSWPLLQPLGRNLKPLRGDLGCLGEVLKALDPSLGLPASGLGSLGPGCGVGCGVLGEDCWPHGGDVRRRTRILLVSSRLAAEPVPESGRWTPLAPEVALG
jgi:hypothetical protein